MEIKNGVPGVKDLRDALENIYHKHRRNKTGCMVVVLNLDNTIL